MQVQRQGGRASCECESQTSPEAPSWGLSPGSVCSPVKVNTPISQCPAPSLDRPHTARLQQDEVISQSGLFNEAQQLTAAISLGFEMRGGYIPFPPPLHSERAVV